MLAPPLEALDGLETLVEGLQDDVDELSVVRDESDPEVLDIRGDLAVLLDEKICFIFIFSSIIFFFLSFFANLLDFQVSQQIEVFGLRFASRGWQEVIDRLLLDFVSWKLCCVIEDDVCVE